MSGRRVWFKSPRPRFPQSSASPSIFDRYLHVEDIDSRLSDGVEYPFAGFSVHRHHYTYRLIGQFEEVGGMKPPVMAEAQFGAE